MRTLSGKLSAISLVVFICSAMLVSAAGWQPDPAMKLLTIVKVSQIMIDGNLADWAGAKWDKVLPNANNLNKVVTDPKDASLEFAVQWDDGNIYFAGKGSDNDLFVTTLDGGNAWDGDCVEFCFSFNPAEAVAVFSEADYKFTFAKTAPSGNQVWANKRNIGGVKDALATGAELFIEKSGEGAYVVEAKIPLTNCAASVAKLKADSYLGLQVALDDGDKGVKEGKRKDQLIWQGDTNSVNVPALWGYVLLR